MIDIELFLISLRNHKDSDGLRHPIYLADSLQEEIKILQDAINAARREWVGLTDEEIWKHWWDRPEVPDGGDDSMEAEFVSAVRAIAAKLKEKNA